jgi:hypothetical protein
MHKFYPADMQVQFDESLDDVIAFSLHHFHNSEDVRRRLRRTKIWGIVSALVLVLIWPRWGFGLRTLFFAAYAMFFLFWYPAYSRWLLVRNTRKLYEGGQNKGALGNHIIGLDAEGVTEISEVGESRIAWSGIEKVEENGAYVFLYVGSSQAHVIPKRAFLSQGEAVEFFKLAQAYHAGSPRLTGRSKADGL